jgi:Transmembrane protein 188
MFTCYFTLFLLMFQVTLFESLLSHPMFSVSCILLAILFMLGIHKRVVATSMYPSLDLNSFFFRLLHMSFVLVL